jgi:hypothetical protein
LNPGASFETIAFRVRAVQPLRHPPNDLAERQGFEPWCRIAATIRFPTGAFRPLGHLSMSGDWRLLLRAFGTNIEASAPHPTGARLASPVPFDGDTGTPLRQNSCRPDTNTLGRR